MIFRKAISTDAQFLSEAMQKIQSAMWDPSLYVIDSLEDIQQSIDGVHGFGLLAYENEIPVGYFIFRFPDPEENDHLGDYLHLTKEEKKHVVYMDSTGVFPQFRSHGIQGKLLSAGEALLKNTPYSIAMCTVSPDNPASLHTFTKHGYQIIATAKKYGGFLRHILYKSL